ncbi:MAG TPA: TIGR02444 family protein [Thioalkalivibrio sp.]|nr:TIGR02444 family protein [Thioalkalivibrio sp.]
MASTPPSPDTHHAIPGLWDFACELYARPGIREICLDWQTRFDADIPLVLALCWRSAQGGTLPDPGALTQLAGVLSPWRRDAILPLRSLRTRLKALDTADSPVTRLRAAVLEAELQAERTQLTWLADSLPLAAPAPGKALGQVLADYLGSLGADEQTRTAAAGTLMGALGLTWMRP